MVDNNDDEAYPLVLGEANAPMVGNKSDNQILARIGDEVALYRPQNSSKDVFIGDAALDNADYRFIESLAGLYGISPTELVFYQKCLRLISGSKVGQSIFDIQDRHIRSIAISLAQSEWDLWPLAYDFDPTTPFTDIADALRADDVYKNICEKIKAHRIADRNSGKKSVLSFDNIPGLERLYISGEQNSLRINEIKVSKCPSLKSVEVKLWFDRTPKIPWDFLSNGKDWQENIEQLIVFEHHGIEHCWDVPYLDDLGIALAGYTSMKRLCLYLNQELSQDALQRLSIPQRVETLQLGQLSWSDYSFSHLPYLRRLALTINGCGEDEEWGATGIDLSENHKLEELHIDIAGYNSFSQDNVYIELSERANASVKWHVKAPGSWWS